MFAVTSFSVTPVYPKTVGLLLAVIFANGKGHSSIWQGSCVTQLGMQIRREAPMTRTRELKEKAPAPAKVKFAPELYPFDRNDMKFGGKHHDYCVCPVCFKLRGEHHSHCVCPHCQKLGGTHFSHCACPICGKLGGKHDSHCTCPRCNQRG